VTPYAARALLPTLVARASSALALSGSPRDRDVFCLRGRFSCFEASPSDCSRSAGARRRGRAMARRAPNPVPCSGLVPGRNRAATRGGYKKKVCTSASPVAVMAVGRLPRLFQQRLGARSHARQVDARRAYRITYSTTHSRRSRRANYKPRTRGLRLNPWSALPSTMIQGHGITSPLRWSPQRGFDDFRRMRTGHLSAPIGGPCRQPTSA